MISVVIPAKNEERNIGFLLDHLEKASQMHQPRFKYEAIVVDDSTDETARLAWHSGARIVKGQGLGLPQAIIDGINSADNDIVVVMDADFSHNPHAIPGLIRPLLAGTHELVIGSRYVPGGMVANWPWQRRLSSWGAKQLARSVTTANDPTSGFFAFHKPCIDNLILEPRSWKMMLEILVKARPRVLELPIEFNDRFSGKSKVVARKDAWDYTKHLWHLRRYKVAHSHPAYEWEALQNGNALQKWWKRAIIGKVAGMTTRDGQTLDVGCGSSPIITRFPDAIGLDLNIDKINFMKRRLPGQIFEAASAEDIPFKDKSFDRVLCIEVVEHLDNPQVAMKEFNRILKPEGQLVLATPDFGSLLWRTVEAGYGLFMRHGYHDDHHSPFTKETIMNLASSYGFRCNQLELVASCDMVIDFRKTQ